MKIIKKQADLEYALKHIKESDLALHGHVWTIHKRNGNIIAECDEGKNTFTTEGMANILNVYFKAVTQPSAIYLGIFKGNVTPVLTDTAAAALGSGGRFTECLDADYTPATNRPAYTIATTSTAGCTNDASKAEFVMAAAITVYGAFLATSQAKTATTGVLSCAKRFTTAKVCEIGDELAVKYALTLTTS